jgi:hypothetical protein
LKSRRWKKELSASERRERDWRDESDKIYKRYKGEDRKKNRYNVLWATTTTLRPAIYNSKPQPDVRRRFRDADPLGKAVGEVLERSLFFLFDGDEPDSAIKHDLLDALLGGRGVSVVRYVPKLAQEGATRPADPVGSTIADSGDGQATSQEPEEDEGTYEQVEYEQVSIEHVNRQDYREGYGRVWDEVPWIAIRHKMIRPDAEEKFGQEALKGITFAVPQQADERKRGGAPQHEGETGKVAEFWEIWDKLGGKVFFLCEQQDHLLYPLDNPDGEPPLDFQGFFPCPDPLRLVEDSESRLPIPLFRLYETQADQLDELTGRINRIVKVCRLRGIYDSKIPEIADLTTADDNELIPVQNAQQWGQAGLEGAIAYLPTDQLVKILAALYDARERQLTIIDRLTGVSDIVQGSTDPGETATAQALKSNYHSIRLGFMRSEVERYTRDLMRLSSQVMCSKFAPETFAAMTDLKFPTAQQKQLMQVQAQMAASQGQPPNPNAQVALQVPTWEDILGLMHKPAMRQFRVDVETDSTVAGTLDSDMGALSLLLRAIGQLMTELAPLVQSGALPVDAAKEVVMAVVRRARLGTAVEDAFDKMQAPKPPPDPAQAMAQAKVQQTQAEGQVKLSLQASQEQHEERIEQYRQTLEDHRLQMEAQREQQQQRDELARKAWETRMEQQSRESEARMDAAVKIIVATISASKQPDPQAGPRAEADYQGGVQ